MPRNKEYVGRVISAKMQKTVVVAVEWVQHHPLYKKAIRRITKLYAHDPRQECRLGDVVRVIEVRPLSKTKRWVVKEILRRGAVPEVAPTAIGQEVEHPLTPSATPAEGGQP
ncbi:MAG: 30S ribosomal protein S17 [Dehalococcoidia bacterium]|nr:30S ribosomal protein S17 [Dehalococcoidia bacterium]MDW8119302.1 30S ribosomal protein S17 [Chloroflexota bacterium]